MGNFYCNLSVLGPEAESVATVLRSRKRRAFVAPTRNRVTVVYEQSCDHLDTEVIDWLGVALSLDLSAPVLAALNADDDFLMLSLYESGRKTLTYMSRGAPGGAFRLSRVFGRMHVFPVLAAVLLWPVFIFEVYRHRAIANLLGLPPWAVGAGFRYVAEGDLPVGLAADQLLQT